MTLVMVLDFSVTIITDRSPKLEIHSTLMGFRHKRLSSMKLGAPKTKAQPPDQLPCETLFGSGLVWLPARNVDRLPPEVGIPVRHLGKLAMGEWIIATSVHILTAQDARSIDTG